MWPGAGCVLAQCDSPVALPSAGPSQLCDVIYRLDSVLPAPVPDGIRGSVFTCRRHFRRHVNTDPSSGLLANVAVTCWPRRSGEDWLSNGQTQLDPTALSVPAMLLPAVCTLVPWVLACS